MGELTRTYLRFEKPPSGFVWVDKWRVVVVADEGAGGVLYVETKGQPLIIPVQETAAMVMAMIAAEES